MHFQSLATLAMPAVAMAVAIPQDTVQIVGGVAASQGDFPFIVSMQRSGSHICGGSLLNANTVLTAAHCAEGQSASNIKVRAGSLVSDPNPLPSIYGGGTLSAYIQTQDWMLTYNTEQELWRHPRPSLFHQDPPQLLELLP
jgi:secreted trypsin-like serine protease